MDKIKIVVGICAFITTWTGGYLIGFSNGEMKVKEIVYLVENLERRIGAIDVIENGKTSGFAKAMINEE